MSRDLLPSPAEAARLIADRKRLDAVRATGLLDTPPEERFDHLTRTAAEIVGAPAAFLSLVDEDHDFFKSASGFPEPLATERKLTGRTFCHYTILSDGVLVLDDARKYEVFRDIPSVQTLGVVAYVGIPLLSRDHQPLGAFCVVDLKARQWNVSEIDALVSLARTALQELDHRPAACGPDISKEPCAAPVAATLEWLYQTHASRIYPLLLQMMKNATDAQDVLQETFVQAWQQLERYDPRRSSLAGWLVCIARSRALDRLRQSKRRGEQPEISQDVPDEDTLQSRIEVNRIREAMQRLPEAQRSTLLLAYFEGLTHSEIARRLGAPVGTVKTRLLLGMRRLRNELRVGA